MMMPQMTTTIRVYILDKYIYSAGYSWAMKGAGGPLCDAVRTSDRDPANGV